MNKRQKIMVVLCAVLLVLLTAASAVAEQELLMAADRDQAILLLREQLVARNEDFTILMPGKSMKEKEANKLYEEALEHTGNPKEGDYLRAHMIDCIPEISKTKVDKKNYVQLHYVPTYKSSAAMEQEVDAAVEAFFATYPVKEKATQYEKIEAVYDFLCDTITYDFARKHGTELFYGERDKENVLIANTAYAGLVEGTCVCEGYASSFYRLMLEMGIDARLVDGFAGEQHAWNIVELDGQYYYVDATWDASNVGWFDYFLQPELWNHTVESEFVKDYAIAAEAYTLPPKEIYTSGDYTYSVTYGACILGYSGQGGDVVVPEKLDGIPVVSMKNYQGSTPFVFDGKTSITLPEGFRHARNICISMCFDLKTINLPSTFVRGADEGEWMDDCERLSEIRVAEGNRHIQVIDGILYTKDGKTLMQCPPGFVADTIVVPEGVETIGTTSFRKNKYVRKVVLPEGVETIGSFAFDGATSLEEVNIPDSCKSIDQWAFGNTALKELHLPAGLEVFGGSVVSRNTQLQTVTLEEGCKNLFIEDGVLYYFFIEGYNNLMIYPAGLEAKSFTLPDHVKYIANGAFNNAQFESVTFNDGLICINHSAFYKCNNLTEIITPPSVECIENAAFWGCENIKSFTVLNDQAILENDCFGWYNESGPAKPLLRGHAGSTIESFAATYNFPFEVIE